MEDELLLIGEIVGTHGLQGRLRVRSYAESHATLSAQSCLYLRDKQGNVKRFRLSCVQPYKKGLLIEVHGISSIDEAEELVGASILVKKDKLDSLPEDEYYWFQIIGLKVFTDGGAFLGTVERILETGSNDVYVVRDGEKEYLIPAIVDIVTEIDVSREIMIVHPLEGLFGDGEI